LLANLFLPHLVKIAVTDGMLLFFETVAALALVNYFHTGEKQDRWWFVLGVAGALLVKGPPVLILTFGMLGLLLLFYPNRRRWAFFHPWLLFPLAAVPLLLWGRLAWQTDDGVFIRWMIDWYTFSRVGGEVLGQTGPPGYYLVTILIAFLPWTLLFVKAFRDLLVNFKFRNPDKTDLFLAVWLVSGWLIYELMRSKLPAYAIGAYPALALLLGRTAVRLKVQAFKNELSLKIGMGLYLLLWFVLAIALPLAVKPMVSTGVVVMAAAIGVTVVFIALWVVYQAWNSNYEKVVGGILTQTFGFLLAAWLFVLPGMEPLRGATKSVAQTIRTELPPHTRVYFTRNFQLPTLPYYVARAGYTYKEALSSAEWTAILASNEAAVLVFNDEDWADFLALGLEYRLLASHPGWISDRGKFVTWRLVTR
jgi:4-amino-4-deoxy-L-arabinose transferase-like glycosyltransferase